MSEDTYNCVDCGVALVRKANVSLDESKPLYCSYCWRERRRPPQCYNCGRFVPWKNLGGDRLQEYTTVYWKCDHCGEVSYQD